jgi:hypothetical protein
LHPFPFHICECNVIKPDLLRTLCAAPLLLSLAGCMHAAKDFGGSWKPVNHFSEEPTEIPLARSYAYYASPMDGTLKTLLTRWSEDTGMVLSYLLTSDFTLYQPVSKIQTNDVRSAAAELTTIYAAEGVLVTINDKQILVGTAAAAKRDASDSVPTTGAAKSATPSSYVALATAGSAGIAVPQVQTTAPPTASSIPTPPAAPATSPIAATSVTSAADSLPSTTPVTPSASTPVAATPAGNGP